MATIFIDDRPYEVDDGQNLLQACLTLGFDLPYFCWHPALHSAGACRQCAVKLFHDEKDRRGRIVMSCMTPAADGTRISVDDPEARAFRASVIEWLMANHPHDCPVCDEGGECHLQDMTVMTGHVSRRYRYPKRTHVNQDLGPFVNHEMNRCIQCYRCVRFYRDYAGGRDFHVFAAKRDVYFGRHAEGPLESEFAGNLVEVCPTGVFTDKLFKGHYARKWDLQTAPSVCVHCAVGCNTIPGERDGTLRRIRNRYNGEVNGYFLCDRGRYGYGFVNGEGRIRQPLLREGRGASRAARPAGVQEALLSLSALLQADGPRRLIGIGSPRASLETNFALRTLVGGEQFFSGLARREQRLVGLILEILTNGPARTPSLREAEEADAVFILGEDVPNRAPRLALALRQSVRRGPMAAAGKLHIPSWDDIAVREALQQNRGFLFAAGMAASRLDPIAAGTLRAAPDDLARLGFAVARALSAGAPPVPGLSGAMEAAAQGIARALLAAGRPLVISGTASGSEDVIRAAGQVARALCESGRDPLLLYVMDECNSLGSGLLEGRPLEEAVDAVESAASTTVLVVENDLARRADAPLVERLFAAAGRLVVADHTASATSERADVVLPAASFAEAAGTYVNLEGRAQRAYAVMPPGGDVRSGWRWIAEMMRLRVAGSPAGQNGAAPDWRDLDDVASSMIDEVRALKVLRFLARPASFRLTGRKIPRQPHRSSGRTAVTAHRDVREPRPVDDPDSPLAYSMEGAGTTPPPALICREWAPGWNSAQAVNRLQSRVGGPLRGGDPGLRLLAPAGMDESGYTGDMPGAFEPRQGQWLLVPLWHVFGSEELSRLAAGVASLSPAPYVAVNPAEERNRAFVEGQMACVAAQGRTYRLPVRIDRSLPAGTAGIPAGLVPGVSLPAWGVLEPRTAKEA